MRLLLVLALVLPSVAFSQGGGKKGPPPIPKNLKVLNGMSPEQVIQVMRATEHALGVECAYCHKGEDFADDSNPKKAIALMMFTMTKEVNAKFTDNKEHVTCYTCHRGAVEPLTAPPPAEDSGAKR
jgi:hypothetical protein